MSAYQMYAAFVCSANASIIGGQRCDHAQTDVSPTRCVQALNNWALVLQELTGLRPPSERAFLVAAAAAKFRRAIRLRPEFDRACYNLGTVYYSHAMALQTEAGKAGGQDASAAAASPAGQPSQQVLLCQGC